MPRLTSKLLTDLAIWMLALGLVIGLLFPVFLYAMGLPASHLVDVGFVAATVLAGVLLGAVNYGVVRWIVRPRLRLLADHMHAVTGSLHEARFTGDWSECSEEACRVPVDSGDELGEVAMAFNGLIAALHRAHEVELAAQSFSHALASHLDLDALGREALEHLITHVDVTAGAIFIESEGELTPLAGQGITSLETLAQSPHLSRVMRTQRMETLELPADVRLDALLAQFRPRQALMAPVGYKDVPLGVLVLASGDQVPDDKRRLLGLFRPGLGLALNNALAHDHLQRLAALDPLTGLYNRRFGLSRLHEEFGRAVRADSPLAVLMFDIDRFKQVNDTYGHLVGDRVLVYIATRARHTLREGDVLARYGGEEFLAVLPGASRQDAVQIAERLRHSIAEGAVYDQEQALKVTISAGVRAYPAFAADHDSDLLRAADEALYQAKQGGRNRVAAP